MNEWLNKLGEQPHRGKLLSDNKKAAIHIHNNLDDSLENHAELEKPTPKGCILYDSIYITFLK